MTQPPTPPRPGPGRIVRYRCSCGWEGEDLLIGRGEAAEFALIESIPCTCRGCKAILHRFFPREGVAAAEVEELAVRRGDATPSGGLPGRALRAIAAEASSHRVLCPLCRRGEMEVVRSGAPPCPVCGKGCLEVETGRWR